MPDHIFGDAAHEKAVETGTAMGADDYQISAELNCTFQYTIGCAAEFAELGNIQIAGKLSEGAPDNIL